MFAIFVRRPILAGVISALIFLIGLVAIPTLPIAQYPQIAPPQVVVTSTYIGADAQTVESAVTNPLEEQINGVQNMQYISSSSSSAGTSTITVTFDPSRNIDLAAVDVQNRVQDAEGILPASVVQTGVQITKTSGSFVMAIAFTSSDPNETLLDLSNFLDRNVKDPLLRISGISSAQIFGERKYAMRIWLDPRKLQFYGLGPADVTSAVAAQNVQVPAGQVGAEPSSNELQYTTTVHVPGQLVTPAAFDRIIVKHGANGSIVRLSQVARTELGADDYSTNLFFANKATIGMGIQQNSGANTLTLSKDIRARLAALRPTFPSGVDYSIPYDTSLFVQESTNEVVITLIIAILLVVATIYLFLQDFRTTFIPVITIPISLVGTFAFVKAFGFSINSLVLFGITLATGLVVDDAIVVIENITRVIETSKDLSREDATIEGVREIVGAVIATSLVLLAVFIPTALLPGTTGEIYKQFALTIAFSITISAIVSVTLTPALAALLIGDVEQKPRFVVFRIFNRGLDWLRDFYRRMLPIIIKLRYLVAIALLVVLGVTYLLSAITPTGFIPDEDQGVIFGIVQAPEGASLNVTDKAIKQIEKIAEGNANITSVFAIAGFSFTGSASNQGLIFLSLKPWGDRHGDANSASGVIGDLAPKLARVSTASVQIFNPPAIQGLGTQSGFDYELEDKGAGSIADLEAQAGKIIGAADTGGELSAVYTTFRGASPTYEATVHRAEVAQLGASIGDVFTAISTTFGSDYVNNFTYKNRTYRVYVENDAPFRSQRGDLLGVGVPNSGFPANTTAAGTTSVSTNPTTGTTATSSIPSGTSIVPLASVLGVTNSQEPPNITHYQLSRSVEIVGSPASERSSGQALTSMQNLSKKLLSPGYGYDWTGISLDETSSGNATILIFAFGIIVVFLVLAALYESLGDPLIILLSVPAALLGAFGALDLRGIQSDVYAQVGFVMLIGLAAKNAILIVEFANQQVESGKPIAEAVIEGAATRLRPILMTSIAFILGLVPLVFATGAGAASRHSLGTAVIGGMIVSTFLNLIVVPALYVIVNELGARMNGSSKKTKSEPQQQRLALDGPTAQA